jgi:hypothetical protein
MSRGQLVRLRLCASGRLLCRFEYNAHVRLHTGQFAVKHLDGRGSAVDVC